MFVCWFLPSTMFLTSKRYLHPAGFEIHLIEGLFIFLHLCTKIYKKCMQEKDKTSSKICPIIIVDMRRIIFLIYIKYFFLKKNHENNSIMDRTFALPQKSLRFEICNKYKRYLHFSWVLNRIDFPSSVVAAYFQYKYFHFERAHVIGVN